MTITHSERRQIENEMIFRRVNEKVGDDLGALDAMHVENGDLELVRDKDLSLLFNCECSDEDCDVRIPMLLDVYQKIHTNRDTFLIRPNHQVDHIEKILKEMPEYIIVKKNNSTPEPNDELKQTSVDNSERL